MYPNTPNIAEYFLLEDYDIPEYGIVDIEAYYDSIYGDDDL